jgi:kynureninase
MDFLISRDFARTLDRADPLARYRADFFRPDAGLVYFDGNSLGALPYKTLEKMDSFVREQWGTDLIRGWNKNWWDAAARVGEKIASLVGAAPGQVLVSDSTSMNLYKLAGAALKLRPQRRKIITDTFNFPSDIYILQGLAASDASYKIVTIGAADNDITPDLAALDAAIDEDTALVTLSHVVFKSGYLYDMAKITEMAHKKGALVLWDLSHSVGSVDVQLDAADADFAIGCTYKYLNGGPGSPAFLYVNKKLQAEAVSPIWGWWGQDKPFDFGLDYSPAPGVNRFLVGTQPMLSILAMEESLTPTLSAGMAAIREKSVKLTEYSIQLQDALLSQLGFTLGSPRQAERRGSHISIRHPEGYRINRALIDEMNVIPDFRAPDNLRLGFAPLYVSFEEVWEGFDRIRRVVVEKRYEKYPKEKLAVT